MTHRPRSWGEGDSDPVERAASHSWWAGDTRARFKHGQYCNGWAVLNRTQEAGPSGTGALRGLVVQMLVGREFFTRSCRASIHGPQHGTR